MVRAAKAADPSRPFLLYFAHGAVHAPLQAPCMPTSPATAAPTTRAGTPSARLAIERQIELGVIAEDTRLAPRNQRARL